MNANVTNTETKTQGIADALGNEFFAKMLKNLSEEQIKAIMNMSSSDDMSYKDALKLVDLLADSLDEGDVGIILKALEAADADIDEDEKLVLGLVTEKVKRKKSNSLMEQFAKSVSEGIKEIAEESDEFEKKIEQVLSGVMSEPKEKSEEVIKPIPSEAESGSLSAEKLKKLVERSTVLIKKGKNCSKREIEQFLRDVDEVMKADKNDMLAILAKSVGNIHPDVAKKLEAEKKKAEIEAESKKAFSYGEVLQQAGVQTI